MHSYSAFHISTLTSDQQAQTTPSQTLTRNEILKQAKERRERFDEEMRQAEKDALNDFKEGLRKAVVL